jgi:hypothetical protein
MNISRFLPSLLCICSVAGAADQYIEKLLAGDFPGKTIHTLSVQDFKKLNSEERKQFVATGVIGPLVAVLESEAPEIPPSWLSGGAVRYAEKKQTLTPRALRILHDLTRRNCGDAVMEGREKNPKAIRRVVDWWSEWWAKNRDKHPMVDDALEVILKQRIAAIETQILNDLASDYHELEHFHPKDIRIRYIEPLFNSSLDSSILAEGILRRSADGSIHMGKDEDHIFLLIAANFNMAPPPGEFCNLPAEPPKRRMGRVVEVFTENVPQTDVVITVHAGPKDGDFVRRVKESLSKLRPLRSE